MKLFWATDTDGETSVYLIHADGDKQKRLAGFKNVYEKMDLRPVAVGKYNPEEASVTFTIKESNDMEKDWFCWIGCATNICNFTTGYWILDAGLLIW